MILIGINVVVFLYGSTRPGTVDQFGPVSGHDVFRADYGLYGPLVHDKHEWWRIITSGFLHASFFHILMNMALLAQMGRVLEQWLGRVRFAVLYFVSLLCGSAGVLLVGYNQLTIGASGAVFGLIAAMAVGLRNRRISIWSSGIGGLIALNLVFTFAIPGISAGGHVGGLIGGATAGSALMLKGSNGRPSKLGIPIALVIGAVAALVCLTASG